MTEALIVAQKDDGFVLERTSSLVTEVSDDILTIAKQKDRRIGMVLVDL